MLTDRAYHFVVSVTPVGEGNHRRLSYSLSDVVRRTDPGNDPLADWAGRNPGRHALWLQWSPLAGVLHSGETEGASALASAGLKAGRPGDALLAQVLRGVEIALRIEDGYYGEDGSHISFAPKEVPGGAQE